MTTNPQLFSITSRVIQVALVLCFWGLQTGCRNENRFEELHLTTVTDALDLSKLKTQASFRAEVVEVNIIVETNAVSVGTRRNEQDPTNFYQIVLRDQQGREQIFAGVNASETDLEALRNLKKTNTYTFPSVLIRNAP